MITLRQACVMLNIRSYRTLQKWLDRLGIEPVRQHYTFDHRLGAITDEHVALIRAAREELADTLPHVVARLERPLSAPQGRILAPGGRPPLSDGWISHNRWLDLHHVNRFSALTEIERGNLPEPERGEWWPRGHTRPTLSAYSPEQHAAASRYAARRWRERFTPCEICQDALG